MFIKRYGTGSNLFLGLHGWSGDHHTFEPLMRDIPSDVSFYAVDLPGYGLSGPPAGWTLDAVAQAITEVARQLPGPFTLVGHCSGALLGLLAAKHLPTVINRLILIDIFAAIPWYFRVFLVPVFGTVAYHSTFANPIGRWIANLSLRKHRTSETTLTGGFARTRHSVTYRYLKLFKDFPAPIKFNDFTMPIDIVRGERTFAAVTDSVAVWRNVWPQAQAWCLKDAGHLPILEATGELREILFTCAIPTTTR